MWKLGLDEICGSEGAVDFEASVGADPGCVQDEAEVVQHGADGVDFEVDGALEGGVVGDGEGAEEPGADYVVVEDWWTDLLCIGLGGSNTAWVSELAFEIGRGGRNLNELIIKSQGRLARIQREVGILTEVYR